MFTLKEHTKIILFKGILSAQTFVYYELLTDTTKG